MAKIEFTPREDVLAILASMGFSVTKAKNENMGFFGWDYMTCDGIVKLVNTFENPISDIEVLHEIKTKVESEHKPWTPQPDETVMYWSGVFDEWRDGTVIREWRGDILVSDSEHATIVPCDFDEVLPESDRQHAEEVNLCNQAKKEVGPYADDFTINELVINGWRPKD